MLFKKKCKHINNRTVTNLTKEYDPNCNVMNFYIKEKE